MKGFALVLIVAAGLFGVKACVLAETERFAPDGLYGTWFHSYEESSDALAVYRAEGFNFPPSRGREGFTLYADGRFVWHRIAPADGLMDVPARWRIAAESPRVLIVLDTDGQPTHTLEVVERDEDRIELKVDVLRQ